jgi:Na+-driven multidrug efflux pump
MSLLVMFLFLLFLNIFVVTFSSTTRSRWITSGLIVMLLCSPIVTAITIYIIGTQSGDGIGAGVAGVIFGIATFMNGSIFLIKGLFPRKNQSVR